MPSALASLGAGGPGDIAPSPGFTETWEGASFAQWDAHPQGRALAGQPVLQITAIAGAPPTPLFPPVAWPAISTVHAVLDRHGLVRRRRRRLRPRLAGTRLTQPVAPNRLWCADYRAQSD